MSAARPDPEDGTHTLANLLIFRASDVIAAALYATALPWWKPLGWLAMVATTGTLRWWLNSRPAFLALPAQQRRTLYRWRTWAHMASLGSAAYWLYAPGDPLMAMLLGVHMVGMATVAALRLSSDFQRTAIALVLIVGPTSLHSLLDGALRGSVLLVLMGVGGLFTVVTALAASRLHERTLDQQYDRRRQAEQAADAVAQAGLDKSRFFAAVSHDLRQPVHAIGLYLEPLMQYERAHALPLDVVRAVEGVRVSWKALDGLLAEVLDLARMDAADMQPQLEPVHLGRLVRSVVLEHGASAEARAVRLTALTPDTAFGLADPLMLRRVLSNLLDNSIKFSPRGATVVIALRRAAGGWRLQVRDAGPGIAPEAQARVFEEFVQVGNDARQRGEGYGLGLAIARRLTRLMGGTLTLRSDIGRGCTMTVVIPATGDAPREPDFGSEPAALASPSMGFLLEPSSGTFCVPPGLRDVLVVEDDALVAAAIVQLLESWGHRALHVASAAHALEAADAFQFAICDMRLPPGMSGFELACALQQLGKKVMLITGETDAPLRVAAAAASIPLLVKPVAPARLHAAIVALGRGELLDLET